tara:strand:+ start:2846 stop:3565 length:720 start_codon:yes stop_codon:yes gene_type:complete
MNLKMMTEDEFHQTPQYKQLSGEPVTQGTAEVIGIFPTPIYIQQNAVEEDDIKNLRGIDLLPEHDFTANYGFQSANNSILDLPENSKLREKIKYFVNDFANNAMGFAGEYEITQSWVSIKKPFQMHYPHVHPNSIVSGVLYFDNVEDAESISFYKNIDATDYVMRPALDKMIDTVFKHNETSLTVTDYMLVLFPSYLKHGVMTNQREVNRYSLAFNAVPKYQLGLQNDLTQLEMPGNFK